MATRTEKWQAAARFWCIQTNRLCHWSARAFESLVSQGMQLTWGPAVFLEEDFGKFHERTSTRCKAQPTDVHNLVTTYHDRRYGGQLCLSQKSHSNGGLEVIRWLWRFAKTLDRTLRQNLPPACVERFDYPKRHQMQHLTLHRFPE